jgi:L-ascorbate metabolism protein UlaG (beta-lactamase superfamily)
MREEPADVVLVSHEHGDHNYIRGVLGSPEAIRESKTAHGISFQAIDVLHDDQGGKARGKNRIFCFELDGIRVCHLGDLGHALDEKQAKAVGKPDVLFTPVGGTYTIDAKGATAVVEKLAPRVVIPMHYRTGTTGGVLSPVDDFLKGKENVERIAGSEVQLSAATLPRRTKIMVLEPPR